MASNPSAAAGGAIRFWRIALFALVSEAKSFAGAKEAANAILVSMKRFKMFGDVYIADWHGDVFLRQ